MVVRVALDVSAAPARLAGAGRYMAELVTHLTEVDLEIVTRRNDESRWIPVRGSVHGIVASPRPVRLLEEALWLGWSKPARQSDLWHGPHYTMPLVTRRPVVVTVHDMTFFSHPEWHEAAKVAFFRSAISRAARRAAAVVCVSEATASEFADLAPRAPVVVAPHGVDVVRFRPDADGDGDILTRAGLDREVPAIVFVGTLEPRKGVDTLVDAFANVARAHPEVELWLAGQPGWGLDVDTLIASSPARERIRRLGFVDDELLAPLLRRADVVAYPSRGEGFGLPVLEALACGSPVVTTRGTVMEEVAGGCATLVHPGDARELADALSALLEAGRHDVHRAARGVARAREFTWERSARAHVTAYERALS